MRYVTIEKPGGLARRRTRAGPGEVVVDVEAAGVNYADCVVRMGLYASANEYVGWPVTPGFEAAGVVAALGEGVRGPPVGTRVIAVTRFGGYASRIAVPAHQVFPIPDGVGTEEAAGFAVVYLTAWYALFELVHPRPGSTLLVHSAAGGVGGALCRLGKIAGPRVVGVVGGSHKIEAARAEGADEVIDKGREDLWKAARRHAPDGYDVVLDANGPATLKRSYEHLAPAGRLVAYGFGSMLPKGKGRPNVFRLLLQILKLPRFNPLRLCNDNKSVLAFNLSYLFHRKDILADAMDHLLSWLKEGRVRPAPCTPYPWDRVADAHRDLESGRTTGKLVLRFTQ